MKIVLTFDTNYAPHAATAMESIIRNCTEKLEFVVIYYDLDRNTREILLDHFKDKVKSLEFYNIDKEYIYHFKVVKNVPHITGFNVFLRLLICDILPETDKYILYLDCDIIVQDNILNIMDGADLTKPLCAITEYSPNYKLRNLTNLTLMEKPIIKPWNSDAYWYRTYIDLELNKTVNYFNAGVLLINLEYWRNNKINEKAILFLLEQPERAYAADQDALNHVINGNYYALAPKWNNGVVPSGILTNYSDAELLEAEKSPSIIHIVGPYKPWYYLGSSRYQRIYWEYRSTTPWPQKIYSDKTLKNIIKKFIREFIYLLGRNFIIQINSLMKKERYYNNIRIKIK
ncbi:LPS 1,2-glucosyltransferase [Spirochaetia bacterium]|nr:LPS 1,2-glucosyltransferase [Spirochaetia bacterium]